MGRYLNNGYINYDYIDSKNCTFNILVCGRGTGKTYGGLVHILEKKEKFIFMRRTQTELDEVVSNSELSPFNKINIDYGTNWGFEKISKNQYGIYGYDEEGKPSGNNIGISLALSTVSHIRGFNSPNITYWLFDEIVPEEHSRPIKNEAFAFFNAYETLNRNRELEGQKPLKVYMLANSNILGNPYFIALNLIDTINNMIGNNIPVYIDRKRDLGLFIYSDSPISSLKEETALYRLTQKTTYGEMAIKNKFENIAILTGSKALETMISVCIFGDICFYRAKNNSFYYATLHKSGSPPVYTTDKDDVTRFKKKYGYIVNSILNNKLIFEKESIYYLLAEYLH